MGIDYGKAFSDFFKTPKWGMTLLLGSLCMLIPFVGPIVLIGYILRRLIEVRQGKPAKDFDFENFGDHLHEGAWPFLVSLVCWMVIMPLGGLVMMVIMMGALQGGELAVLGSLFGGMLLFGVMMLVLRVLMVPFLLRAGMRQSFGQGFSWAFAKQFLNLELWPMIVSQIIVLLIYMVLSMLGYLALIIGIYPVICLMTFVNWHIIFQHYDRYLAKGGVPIEIEGRLRMPLGGSGPPPPPMPTPDAS